METTTQSGCEVDPFFLVFFSANSVMTALRARLRRGRWSAACLTALYARCMLYFAHSWLGQPEDTATGAPKKAGGSKLTALRHAAEFVPQGFSEGKNATDSAAAAPAKTAVKKSTSIRDIQEFVPQARVPCPAGVWVGSLPHSLGVVCSPLPPRTPLRREPRFGMAHALAASRCSGLTALFVQPKTLAEIEEFVPSSVSELGLCFDCPRGGEFGWLRCLQDATKITNIVYEFVPSSQSPAVTSELEASFSEPDQGGEVSLALFLPTCFFCCVVDLACGWLRGTSGTKWLLWRTSWRMRKRAKGTVCSFVVFLHPCSLLNQCCTCCCRAGDVEVIDYSSYTVGSDQVRLVQAPAASA